MFIYIFFYPGDGESPLNESNSNSDSTPETPTGNRRQVNVSRIPKLVDNKRKHMEKGLSQAQRDHLLMKQAKEEVDIKKQMLSAFEASNVSIENSISKLTTCLTSLGEGIASGMQALAMALGNMPQQVPYPPPHQHFAHPQAHQSMAHSQRQPEHAQPHMPYPPAFNMATQVQQTQHRNTQYTHPSPHIHLPHAMASHHEQSQARSGTRHQDSPSHSDNGENEKQYHTLYYTTTQTIYWDFYNNQYISVGIIYIMTYVETMNNEQYFTC